MIRFLAALFLALTCAAAAAAAPSASIRMGVEGAYPPFNEIGPDGQPRGFDIDIANALCDEMKVRCVWVAQNWDGMIPALISGKFDAIMSSMTITKARREKIAFTDPYYLAASSLVARRGAALDAARPQTLKGRRIGVQGATSHETYAKAVLAPAGARIVVYPTQDEVYADLRSGRIDAGLQDVPLARLGFLKTPEGAPFAFSGQPVADPEYFGDGVGIGLRKDDEARVAGLNAALKRIRANGVYDRIVHKWYDDAPAPAAPTGAAPVDARGSMWSYAGAIAAGTLVTLKVTFGAFALAAALGLAAALCRVYGGRTAAAISAGYSASTRSAPDFIYLLFLYYGGQAALNLLTGGAGGEGRIDIDAFSASVIILGAVYGGYLAETFRGALLAIGPGQAEAGLAFGLPPAQVFFRIIFPQMMRFVLPGLNNNWLVVVKASAMTSMVSLNELVFMSTVAGRATHKILPFLLVAGGVYLLISTVSVAIFGVLARRYGLGVREVSL